MDSVFLLLDKESGKVDNWTVARRHDRSRSRESRAKLGNGSSSSASGNAGGPTGPQSTAMQGPTHSPAGRSSGGASGSALRGGHHPGTVDCPIMQILDAEVERAGPREVA
eukprot:625899-Heterocapsa_arctica.AAC.1